MKEYWLTYGGQVRELRGYADANGSMAEDRHAILGMCFYYMEVLCPGLLNDRKLFPCL